MSKHGGIIVTMDKLCFSYGMTHAAGSSICSPVPISQRAVGAGLRLG